MIGGTVEGSLCGELQGVEKAMTLQLEGAVQLKQGVADLTRTVVHQLRE